MRSRQGCDILRHTGGLVRAYWLFWEVSWVPSCLFEVWGLLLYRF
jgi:hypothetical protein